ncbi:MAG: 1-(5-phosphoribosyl)-5-[(5-phosphoribosylamino)methylideneamino] imidazole-4-carboxamide isomerase [Gemmatimonadales bacterium]
MDLFPAIDIHAGRVVRASRADLARATAYHPDPLGCAAEFVAAGARWLHVVDLDRAFGVGDQTALLASLVKRVDVPVQAGGGTWTADGVAELRDIGIQRILLGARAAGEEAVLADITEQFASDSLGLALDVRDGRAWSRQWDQARMFTPGELAERASEAGIGLLAVTDLSREGALGGADVAGATALAKASGMEVLVSGGVNDLADLKRIRDAGLAGAIVGRALFEKRFTLQEALVCISLP